MAGKHGHGIQRFRHAGRRSLYPRTHGATTPNGTGYIKAFTNTLADRENVQILMDTTGKSLITDGDKVVGVNATGRDGNAVTLMANKASSWRPAALPAMSNCARSTAKARSGPTSDPR